MTQVRKVPISGGITWFTEAINLGRRNPKAVFGAALLFIGTLYGLGLLFILPVVAVVRGGDSADFTKLLGAMVPFFLAMVLLLPILLGGLMHVIREAEAGRPVRARDLFAPIRQRKAGALAMLGLIQIGLALVGGLLVVALAGGDYWRDYLDAMRGAMSGSVPVVPQPDHPGLMMLMQLVFNYFSYAIMLFGVPLILFSGAALGDAVKSSLRASVTNVGTNLLAAILFAVSVVVAALLVGLLGLLVATVGSLIHPVVGAVLSLLLYLVFGAMLLVVLVGGSYLAWRDTFGGGAPASAAPAQSNGFEA